MRANVGRFRRPGIPSRAPRKKFQESDSMGLDRFSKKSLALSIALMCAAAAHAVPVVPGAAGFGMTTPAGRGGTVYRVTNINASGAGSLKACIDATGPRTCVFDFFVIDTATT